MIFEQSNGIHYSKSTEYMKSYPLNAFDIRYVKSNLLNIYENLDL